MIYPGEIFGKYIIISSGEGYVRYRTTKNRTKRWWCSMRDWNEWMELNGFLRKRCNGRPSGTE